MNSTTFFQLFLLVDVFIIGVLSALAAQHAYSHFRPSKAEPEVNGQKPTLSHAAKERMIRHSEEEFQKVLERSVGSLEHDLESSSEQINTLIKRFATDIVSDEMERYRADFDKLHKQTEKDMGVVKEQMNGHQDELKAQLAQQMEADRAKLAEQLEAEKQRLLGQIDTKLADAVASFLTETLQHNVDLGSQSAYLVQMLEDHKADFASEVTTDEA